eukprot:12923633-Prorocentrum_lima.AAC.1
MKHAPTGMAPMCQFGHWVHESMCVHIQGDGGRGGVCMLGYGKRSMRKNPHPSSVAGVTS